MIRCALLLLVLVCGPVYADDCEFSFRVDQGDSYCQTDISDFVEKEIRARLSRGEKMTFTMYVSHKDDSGTTDLPLVMESVALYLESINGVPLVEDVAKYTDDDADLSLDGYRKAFKDATNFSALSKKDQQNVVKHFAFLVAETARFEDIENAANMILNDNCSYHWTDFMNLVRRWKTMSIFVNSQGLARGVQHLGGYRAFLIAPITSSQIQTYNEATVKTSTHDAWKVVRWGYGDPRVVDTASPISVGEGLCPK